MPIGKYYGGHGEKVMRAMRKQYGPRAKEVFYATAQKRKQKPGNPRGRRHNPYRKMRG